jgi:hypothetical protein
MADEALKEMTPEQREQARKLAQEFAKNAGGGGDERGPQSGHAGAVPGSEASDHTASSAPRQWQGGTVPVDARRPAAPEKQPKERTLAEWSGPGDKQPGAPTTPGVSDAMREAAQGAERAVEQQQVPARYSDLVRRVFKRYSEGSAQNQPPSPK